MKQMIKKSLIALGLLFGLMHGDVQAKDRNMMEMIELVVLSQKFEECTKNKDDKAWRKLIPHEEKDEEIRWLTENIYNNNFQGKCVEITIIDKYKNN